MGANGASGGDYNLENSLRFRSSANAYLNRTPATAGNRKTWTWSGWVKRGTLGSIQELFLAKTNSNSDFSIRFGNDDTFIVRQRTSAVLDYSASTSAVFRDPSAWYHIIVAFDTTQSISSDRIKLYVNGQSVSLSGSYPLLNTNYPVNNTIEHQIGADTNASRYLDGYQTEINLIDGQALTPSDFGETNASTGVWQPIEYTGTYGTNGFYLPFENKSAATYINTFNGSSQSLSVVGSADMALGTGDCTVECYFKVDSLVNYRSIIDNRDAGGSSAGFSIDLDVNGSIYNYSNGFIVQSANGTISAGQYYHVAYTRASGTHRLFIDGVQVATSTTARDYTNDDIFIGRAPYGATEWFDGEISNVRIVKGTAVYTSNFTPAITNLTAVTNTKLLTCQSSTIVDNSGLSQTIVNEGTVAASLGNPFRGISVTSDQSGNINNWVSNNINLDSSTATTYDIMTDVPTLTDEDMANYAVINPLNSSTTTVPTTSNANLRIVGTVNAYQGMYMSMAIPSTGKWYFEYTYETKQGLGGNQQTLITPSPSLSGSGATSGSTTLYGLYSNSNYQYGSTGQTDLGIAAVAGNTQMVAYDSDTGKLWWGYNGTWFLSGNPSAGTNPLATQTASIEKYIANVTYGTGGTTVYNFGQRPFAYTPPAGFKKLNTFNLPDSSIVDGSENFDTVLYTGNGSTQSITSLDFGPDLTWIKVRNSASYEQMWFDSVRGATKYVRSNSTAAEGTVANSLTSFDSNGFSLGANGDVNGSTFPIVAWNWKAGGTAVSNTDGTITSSVSANPTAGFSVMTYTGTGVAGSVGHGLGVVPKLYIIKQRTDAGNNWIVQTTAGDGSLDYLFLNATNAKGDSGDALPTSSVLNISGNNDVNGGGDGLVAYCFADVEGYSKIGSYTGNGSADGPFVYTGFRPAYIMIKGTSTSSWVIIDNQREGYNVVEPYVIADSANAESSLYTIADFLSNGFKMRSTAVHNASGQTWIYMAFAENPFKNSLAR